MAKIIFLSSFHPFTTRNVLDAGVLEELAKRAQKVVVFVLKEKEEYLRGLYGSYNIDFIGVDIEVLVHNPRNVRFNRLAEILIDTRTKRNRQKANSLRTGKRAQYVLIRAAMFVCSRPPLSWLLRPLLRWAEMRYNNPDPFAAYFAQYRPDVAFVTDPFDEHDILFWKSAKRAGVHDVVMVRSWDNLVNKTYFRVWPSLLIVQNEDMVSEAVRYHGISRKVIRTGGVPQFEYYRRYQPKSREDFCREMGIDPKKRIVLYSPAGKKYTDTDWQICEILKRQIAAGNLPDDVHVLVRLHPQNFTDLSLFVPDEHFTVEDPGVGMKTNRIKETEISRQMVDHLADELYHCALLINVISSILIDAAVFDKPTVTIGFDGWEKNVPFLKSLGRRAQEEWLQVLWDTGMTPIARNEGDLVRYINEYLAHPEKDRAIRTHFVERHCNGLRGDSAARIAEMISGQA
jgi:CDP-glycerol glycerophosphotransferase (TagB/SpsB family)